MYEISILHDHVTAFLHGQIILFSVSQKGYSNNQNEYIAPK